MPRLLRRFLAIALTLLALAIAVFAVQPAETPTHTFRVVFGLKDKKPTDWNGKINVTGGELLSIQGWRFQNQDKVLKDGKWRCQTREYIKPLKRFPVNLATGKLRYQPDLQPWANGITVQLKGKNPKMVLKLAQGDVAFSPGDLKLGQPSLFLKDQVRIERMPQTVQLRAASTLSVRSPDAVQDDYPAFWVHFRSGKQYLAWVSYKNEKDRVLLSWRQGASGKWQKPIVVAPPGHHFRVALATTHEGALWITWSSQNNNNWDLYARPFHDGKLGKAVRLTNDPGPDIWHQMTTDNQGRAWLVWQGFRKGQSDIFVRRVDDKGWSKTVKVSTTKQNDWNPCICADTKEKGHVWVGWDTYFRSNYEVRVTHLDDGFEQQARISPQVIENSPLFQAHLSLACDPQGRLWAAWDESGPQWGKDTGFLFGGQHRQDTSRLYSSRTIRIKVRDKGKWMEPKTPFKSCLPANMQEYNEYPQLQSDGAGRMWLAFRHRTCIRPREDGWAVRGRWDLFATAYLGDRWLAPVALPDSGGRNDMRTSSQRDPDGKVYFAFASDNRTFFPPNMLPRNHHVAVSKLAGAPNPGKMELIEKKRIFPIVADCHPREKEQVARIRKYKYDIAGKTYRIYRGDLHRHTDISTDGMGDGSLMDLHRYALDAVAFDFIMVGDHNMGNDNEYCWWRTQHSNDLYTVPGSFISMYGYERSVRYPRGHRNVIWAERGHRTLPLPKPVPAAFGRDTERLYEYLRKTNGICTLHTSASSQGSDWTDKIDPNLEPFVEIFQGYHTSYEAPGAPKSINDKTDRIHGKFQPEGFVSKALDKGYKLGFQASSDHISTHTSYACIIAEEFSRKGLIEAMKKRHSYAATDNIIMDVRMGDHLMGEEVVTAKPKLKVVILGTGPIAKVEVVRNNKVIHTAAAKKNLEEVRFEWQDPNPVKGRTSYYYVRMMQRNGQMAWASPIWVTPK